MAKIQLDLTGAGGLANNYYGDKPYTSSSPHLRYLGADNQMAEGIYNPISMSGYLSPVNNTTKTISGTTSFLLTSALVVPAQIANDTDDAIFFADEATTGTTGKIMNLDTAIDTSLDQAYEIPIFDTNKYAKCIDLIKAELNTAEIVFFIRQTTTNSNNYTVGISDRDFQTIDPDWLQTVPVGAFTELTPNGRSFFVLGDNGLLYVMNTHRVHAIDGTATGGTNGTVYEGILQFPTGTRLVDGINYNGKIWVGLHNYANLTVHGSQNALSTKSINQFVGVYIWDKRTTTATVNEFIRLPACKLFWSMHQLNDLPMCFTQSTDGYTQLRIWNGRGMQVVKTLGKNAYPKFRRHSVYEGNDYIIWLGADGYVYYFGKTEASANNSLYIIGDMTAHVTNGQTYSSSGVLVPANATETVTSGNHTESLAFYVSFSDTAGNHLKKWYPFSTGTISSNAQLAHIGNIYSLVKYLPELSRVKSLTIYCAPTTATGSTVIATVKIYINQSSTAYMTKSITQAQASRGYVTFDINKPNVNAIQLEIEYNTSETLGTSDFHPSVGILEYEPTTTHTPDGG